MSRTNYRKYEITTHRGGRHLKETGIKTKLLASEGATQHMAGVDIHMTKEGIGRKGEVIPEDSKEAHHSKATIIEDNLVEDRRNKNKDVL